MVVWLGGWRHRTPAETGAPGVAVLAFSGDDTALASRITENVTTELARLGTVSVASHTSAMQYAGTRTPLRDIATTLNVDFAVEGLGRTRAGRSPGCDSAGRRRERSKSVGVGLSGRRRRGAGDQPADCVRRQQRARQTIALVLVFVIVVSYVITRIRIEKRQRLQRPHPIEEQHAVEMIGLVLDDPGGGSAPSSKRLPCRSSAVTTMGWARVTRPRMSAMLKQPLPPLHHLIARDREPGLTNTTASPSPWPSASSMATKSRRLSCTCGAARPTPVYSRHGVDHHAVDETLDGRLFNSVLSTVRALVRRTGCPIGDLQDRHPWIRHCGPECIRTTTHRRRDSARCAAVRSSRRVLKITEPKRLVCTNTACGFGSTWTRRSRSAHDLKTAQAAGSCW